MPLRDHLRSHEHGPLRAREALERIPQLLRLLDYVGIEPDHLELGDALRELAFELLRACADPREVGRAACRARLPHRLEAAAMVTAQRPVAVERQRDVAVAAAPGQTACAAMDRRRQATPVQEEDRLPAALGDA